MKVWYDFFVSPFAILIISTHYSFPAVNNRHHDEFDDLGPIHPDCLCTCHWKPYPGRYGALLGVCWGFTLLIGSRRWGNFDPFEYIALLVGAGD